MKIQHTEYESVPPLPGEGRSDEERLADVERGRNQRFRVYRGEREEAELSQLTQDAIARHEAQQAAVDEATRPENIARAEAHRRITDRSDEVFRLLHDTAEGHFPTDAELAAATDGDIAAVKRHAQTVYKLRAEGEFGRARNHALAAAHDLADHGTTGKVPPPPELPTDPAGLAALVPRW